MGGIVALLWDPSPLVLELRRKSLPRNWMKALPLALRQSVHVQPSQGSDTTGSPHLQRLQLMHRLVKQSREVGLVSGYLLQGLLVRQETLPSHVPKVSLYLLSFLLRPVRFEPGVPRCRLQEFFGLFASSFSDLLHNRSHQAGGPALIAFPRVTVWKTGYGDALEQFL